MFFLRIIAGSFVGWCLLGQVEFLLGQVAQSPALENLSGGAGWVGAGLLGLVLAWLFGRHLPAKDIQLEKFFEAKDKHVETIIGEFTKSLNDHLTAFAAEQKTEREHCQRVHSDNMAEHRATHADMTAFRHEMRNLINQVILKKAVEDAMKKQTIAPEQAL